MLKNIIENKYIQLVLIVLLTPIVFMMFSYTIGLLKEVGTVLGSYLACL